MRRILTTSIFKKWTISLDLLLGVGYGANNTETPVAHPSLSATLVAGRTLGPLRQQEVLPQFCRAQAPSGLVERSRRIYFASKTTGGNKMS